MVKEIELGQYPNKKWEDFLTKANNHSSIQVNDWKIAQILGYFMARFKTAFNKDYQLKFNSPSPSKSYEVFRINTISTRLSSNPQILKDYIDWIFDQRVARDKKNFRSIAFLTADEQCQHYRDKILFAGQITNIDRSTQLPHNIQPIVNAIGCKTYGDLAFLLKANLQTDEMQQINQNLRDAKFDFGILDKIV
jgi:hypothetical protein